MRSGNIRVKTIYYRKSARSKASLHSHYIIIKRNTPKRVYRRNELLFYKSFRQVARYQIFRAVAK